ncbi:Plasma membrane ATPase [Mycena venus]|uniref:Plasma membrane ATPase n=1 Tax=Mycena venus TaxID=2733690 RepID=A0A8H7CDQ7_9AGAR|nr:Plasma membrane ATPase [Mycena venus]
MIVIDDVFKLLQCDENGLSLDAVQRQFLSFMWNPLLWVMEATALFAIALSNGEGRAPNWQNFVGTILLLFINSAIDFYEERGAGNAVKVLVDLLAPKAKVKCSGSWSEIESTDLILGDMVSFKIGDIVPVDCRLTKAINVSIDQAALTGESLPQSKKLDDQCFLGISTGANTFFRRAVSLVGQDDDTTGHLQMILAQIGFFCLVAIGIFVVLYAGLRYSYCRAVSPSPCTPCYDVILLAAYASRTDNQDAIDSSVVQACGDPAGVHAGIKFLDFKPFNLMEKRMSKLKRITKGMTGAVIELCSRNRTEELEAKLEFASLRHPTSRHADTSPRYATRGLPALAVAYEGLDGNNHEATPPCSNYITIPRHDLRLVSHPQDHNRSNSFKTSAAPELILKTLGA